MRQRSSFVIAVYNGENYLSGAIKSCLGQINKFIEIIVVDDGSTDGTKDIIEYWKAKDSRITAIHLETNKGRSTARNIGIEAARSDFIMILDADDLSLENRVSDTLNAFHKNPTADILYGKFHVIDALNNHIGYVEASPFNWDKLLKTGFAYIGHSTIAFKKSLGVFYTDGEYSKHGIDDWKFYVDAYKKGARFHPLDKFLSVYRLIPKQRDEKKISELKEAALKTC